MLVEVLDSQAAVHIIHRMASKNQNIRGLLAERRTILANCNCRVLTFWQNRKLGWIADLLSKFQFKEAAHALLERYPFHPMETGSMTRAPTLLNAVYEMHGRPFI